MIYSNTSYSTLILSYILLVFEHTLHYRRNHCRTFAPMKTKLLTLLLALFQSPLASHAQFNTISGHAPRACITAINDKEASPESDTSHVRLSGALAPDSIMSKNAAERTSHVSKTYPLRNIKITSPYGYRTDPFSGKRTMHNGVDLAAHSAIVFSMLDGTVEKTGYDSRSGNFIILRHGNFRISYCHLSKILVTKGQSVLAGYPVAITGTTGRSTGEHLHLVAKYKGKVINPQLLFATIAKAD
jgi:murein DD-endopeptidase MepM/ murein hydrolase activator NlpD